MKQGPLIGAACQPGFKQIGISMKRLQNKRSFNLMSRAGGILAAALSLAGGPAVAETRWNLLANENGSFTLANNPNPQFGNHVEGHLVRYGAGFHWNYKYFAGAQSVQCNNTTFGDPVGGVVKQCEEHDSDEYQVIAGENVNDDIGAYQGQGRVVRYGTFSTQVNSGTLSGLAEQISRLVATPVGEPTRCLAE